MANDQGDVADAWESTPHSGGYYHVSGAYFANGAWQSLGGLPGMPSLTYNVDGEGRMSAVSDSTLQTLGTVAGYNVFGQATGVTLGSGDADAFTFDANTGRMTQYKYTVGATPQTVTGNLAWNANGTLNQLAITDQINTANSQTCNYGYDDLARVAGANCGNIWTQTFGYDPFGNLSKTGSASYQPTYNTATNQVGSVGGQAYSYDANGNTLNDTLHTYAWDAEGEAVMADSVSLIYDALGRMVEQNGTTQIVYAPTGQKFALMAGQTVSKAFVQLPGGAQAVYVGSTLTYFRHADWLGSSRLSTTTSQTVYSSLAYAPFGETYAESGPPDRSFTGQNQDTIANGTTGLYDFLYREYALYGRWISPDPAGASVANLGNPQSWNRYVYVRNSPLMFTDSIGLDLDETPGVCGPEFGSCFDGGGGADGGDGAAGDEGHGPPLPKPPGNPPPICGRDPKTEEPIPCYYDDTRFLCAAGMLPGCEIIGPPRDPKDPPERIRPTKPVTSKVSAPPTPKKEQKVTASCMAGRLIDNFIGPSGSGTLTAVVNALGFVAKPVIGATLPGPGWVYTTAALVYDAERVGQSYYECKYGNGQPTETPEGEQPEEPEQ